MGISERKLDAAIDTLYEMYKTDWISRLPKETLIRAREEYFESLDDFGYEMSDYSFEDFLNDRGYDGQLYACKDEFIDAELRDSSYINNLLNRDDRANALSRCYDEYLEDIEREEDIDLGMDR